MSDPLITPEWVDPDRPPEVYLFVSFDIEGSTQFKTDALSHGAGAWGPFFRKFFEQFPGVVRKCETQIIGDYKSKDGTYVRSTLEAWKTLGDEIVFKKRINGGLDAFIGTMAAQLALQEGADLLAEASRLREIAKPESNIHYPSRLKATAWVAGFPVKNLVLRSDDGVAEDFIGPSIDQGFRLARFATPVRMPISVSLAWMISSIQAGLDLTHGRRMKLYFLGRESLKGVSKDGAGYPIFCVNVTGTDPRIGNEECALIGGTAESSIVAFCEKQFHQTNGIFGRPFVLNDHDRLFGFPDESSPEYGDYIKRYQQDSTPQPVAAQEIEKVTSGGSDDGVVGSLLPMIDSLAAKACKD